MKCIVSSLYQTGKNVSTTLQEILNAEQKAPQLQSAAIDAVLNGGKRVRPFLVVETAKLFGLNDSRVLRVAGALECVHCYSLVHDDLPAMDDDDMRRGQPTIHKKYDEATAILAGDGLLTLAFQILADTKTSKDASVRSDLVLALAKGCGMNGMVGGQMLDLQAESSNIALTQDEVENLQDLKTGKLVHAAVEMGAIMGGACDEKRQALYVYAKNIGLAFQIADDLLDALGDVSVMGKSINKDAGRNKATFISLLGIDGAKEYAHKLIADAKSALKIFGEDGENLSLLADFIIDRDS